MINSKRVFILTLSFLLSTNLLAMKRILEEPSLPDAKRQNTGEIPQNEIFYTLNCYGGQIKNVAFQTLAISPLFEELINKIGQNSDECPQINVEDMHCQFLAPMLVHMATIAEKLSTQTYVTAAQENSIIAEISEELKRDNIIADKNNIQFIINTSHYIKNKILTEGLLYIHDYLHEYAHTPRVERHRISLNLISKSSIISNSALELDAKNFKVEDYQPSYESIDALESTPHDLMEIPVSKKTSKSKKKVNASERVKKSKKLAKRKKPKSKSLDENLHDSLSSERSRRTKKDQSPAHVRKSVKNQSLNCKHPGCIYVGPNSELLRKHQKRTHIKCEYSDCNVYGVKKAIKEHYKQQHPTPSFALDASNSNPLLPVTNNIIHTINSEGNFVCGHPGCRFSAYKDSVFSRHAKRDHFLCPHSGCDFSLLRKDLSKHCREIHEKGDFICIHSGCEYSSFYKQQWEFHINQLHFACQHEGCQFSSTFRLHNDHEKIVHTKK